MDRATAVKLIAAAIVATAATEDLEGETAESIEQQMLADLATDEKGGKIFDDIVTSIYRAGVTSVKPF